MVAIPLALAVLYPNADLVNDWKISDIDGVVSIVYFNEKKLGPQPKQADLDAVTQAQVDAAKLNKLRAAAKQRLAGNDELAQLIRAMVLSVVEELGAKNPALSIPNYAELEARSQAVLDAGKADPAL